MHTPDGWMQSYNGQAVVSDDQIVLAAAVTQDHNDAGQLIPMLQALDAALRAAGIDQPVGPVLADAGYWSEANATPTARIGSCHPQRAHHATRHGRMPTHGRPPTAS